MYADLKAVTALYDLGRGSFGRPIEQYIDWLNATLRLPIAFKVFLDPAIDQSQIALKPGDRIFPVPMEQFYPMRWTEKVERVRNASASQDLTFVLPNYSLLMMSKFDMLQRVALEYGEDCRMVWIDAGLSRFFRTDMAEGQLSHEYLGKLQNATFAGSITDQGLKSMREKSADALVGTSTRLVSGGDLYATGRGAAEAARQLHELVETIWLPRGKWDNEQVAMGCMLADGWPGFQVARVSPKFGTLVADLFSLQLRRGGLPGRIEKWLETRIPGRKT
ncbi:hypothetical protein [Devosia faecipullorum]|uniref:hypothetical protein n=1 Tax=Devosia faecipullorum TaxID=2755039 RepID=UPI00187B96C8|nr:hypothetical protein [Devosia faecipullorum]MBE7731828.1 hypothetical protein [Devosia faecipullorum]